MKEHVLWARAEKAHKEQNGMPAMHFQCWQQDVREPTDERCFSLFSGNLHRFRACSSKLHCSALSWRGQQLLGPPNIFMTATLQGKMFCSSGSSCITHFRRNMVVSIRHHPVAPTAQHNTARRMASPHQQLPTDPATGKRQMGVTASELPSWKSREQIIK